MNEKIMIEWTKLNIFIIIAYVFGIIVLCDLSSDNIKVYSVFITRSVIILLMLLNALFDVTYALFKKVKLKMKFVNYSKNNNLFLIIIETIFIIAFLYNIFNN